MCFLFLNIFENIYIYIYVYIYIQIFTLNHKKTVKRDHQRRDSSAFGARTRPGESKKNTRYDF